MQNQVMVKYNIYIVISSALKSKSDISIIPENVVEN